MSRPEVVTDKVPFGEGPVWCPDGTLVCTSVSHGCLFRIWPATGAVELAADTGGGANGALLADDGSFVVAQNGGIDLVALGHVAEAPPVRWKTPSLQHARLDGSVVELTSEAMQAPNDLAVASDGTIYFTDPGPYVPDNTTARVMARSLDGATRVVAGGYRYTNGIALDLDGTSLLVIVDDLQILAMRDFGRGEVEPAVADLGPTGGDGFCLDVEGRYYVCLRTGNAIGVFDRDGTRLELLPLEEGDGFVTNCCFGGEDRRTLFATDSRRSRVVAFESMPSPGLALAVWPTG